MVNNKNKGSKRVKPRREFWSFLSTSIVQTPVVQALLGSILGLRAVNARGWWMPALLRAGELSSTPLPSLVPSPVL